MLRYEKFNAIYQKSNIQNFLFLLYFACHILQFKMLIMPLLSDVWIAQNYVFMISGFVVYRCHDNIDFSKIAIITNFSLTPVSVKNFTSILRRIVY